MARYDDLLSLCFPCHNDVYSRWLLISQLFWLLKLMQTTYVIFWLWNALIFNLKAYVFLRGGNAPRLPYSISMPCKLILLCTITHIITHYKKGPTLTMCTWSGSIYIFLDPLVCHMFASGRIIPLCSSSISLHPISILLGQNPKKAYTWFQMVAIGKFLNT